MEEVLLRVEEAAQLLRVSRWTIYRWIAEGKLEGTKIGRGSLRVFKRSAFALMEARRISEPMGKVVAGGA